MVKKVFIFILFFFFFSLSAGQVLASAVQPGCYTGNSPCGGGGGGGAFTLADQLDTCQAGAQVKADCIEVFCVQRNTAGTYSQADLDQICQTLGYGVKQAGPTMQAEKPSPTEFISPTASPTAQQIRQEEQVQTQEQNREMEDSGGGILVRLRSFFINIFRRIFSR